MQAFGVRGTRAAVRVSDAEVRHVAALARLELREDEIESLARDMNSILDYVTKLEELDTSAVQPTAQVVVQTAPMRQDSVTTTSTADDAVANAPLRHDHFFVVPSIIE